MFQLLPFSNDDRSFFDSLVFNEAIMGMNYGRIFTKEEANLLWSAILTADSGYAKVLLNGAAIGLFASTGDETCREIEYMLLPQYWGCGYASKLVAEQLDTLRNSTAVSAVTAIVDQNNTASIQVLLKNGFVFSEQIQNADGDVVQIYICPLSSFEKTV